LPWREFVIALLLLAGLVATGVFFFHHRATQQGATSSNPTLAAPTAAPAPDKSIAVLPFENLSRDPDNAFFTDGVQDQILTNLAQIADLKVISL
jgi:TolB-like protein